MHQGLSEADISSHLSSPVRNGEPELERKDFELCDSTEGYNWFKKDFVFHFYVSFPDRKGAVGLDICEAVEAFNKRYGFKNFVFKARISSECPKGQKLRRWDKGFIGDFLKDCHVKKVD